MFMRTWEMIQDTQAKKKQSSSTQITLSRNEGTSPKDGLAKPRKELTVKGGIILSIREVFCELPRIKKYA